MKVEITKSIDIADSAPSLPIVKVVKGETRDDLSIHVANRLIELGCAELIPNEEPAKDQDTGDDNSEGQDNESPENTDTSGDNADDTGSDTTGDDQDTENTDESIDEATDDQGGTESQDSTEATPETMKAELEGIALKEMDGPMGSEQKAKAALEAIGKERYGFDVDKRKNVDGIIEAIVEAAFKAE